MAKIRNEWWDFKWEPVTGCDWESPGCRNCYAKPIVESMKEGSAFSDVRVHEEKWTEPLHLKKPSRIFVCSLGDLFHPKVPTDFIHRVYDVMAEAKQHEFVVMTKRPKRIAHVLYEEQRFRGRGYNYYVKYEYLPHVIHVVSVESQFYAIHRLTDLMKLTDKAPGWRIGVNVEPMLEQVNLKSWIDKLSWVICGAESGIGRRPCSIEWVRNLRSQCISAKVPFFYQYGLGDSVRLSKTPVLDGREWTEPPKQQ